VSVATTNKQAAKKTTKTTKKQPAKRAPRKQAAKKQSSSQSDSSNDDDSTDNDDAEESSSSRRRSSAPRASARKRVSGMRVAAMAADQLLELTGKAAEGVTGLERTDDGWKVQVEVVEVRRIPDTTDVLALYEVDVDEDGELESYHRLRRYSRGAPGEE
jgi:hypothetical protein